MARRGLRFYVHVDIEGAAEHTFIVDRGGTRSGAADTLDALRLEYARQYDERYGTRYRYERTHLTDAHGAVLPPAKLVSHVIRRGTDVFLCAGAAPVAPPLAQAEPEALEEFMTPAARQMMAETPPPAKKTAKAKTRSAGQSPAAREVAALLEQSKAAMADRGYRQARRLHEQIFQLDATNTTARREEAEIAIALKDFDGAEVQVGKALSARPKPSDPGLYIALGDALMGQTEYDDAVDAYNTALSQGTKAGAEVEWQHDVKIKLARAHLALNPREATDANQLVIAVLGANPDHRQALLFYGEVMLERGNVAEGEQNGCYLRPADRRGARLTDANAPLRPSCTALPIYLRLVAASMGEDPAIKRPLSKLFALPGAVDALRSTLGPTPGASGVADIYGYLANQAKERGGLSVATELYHLRVRTTQTRNP
jgi:tetratricopeptide (TPR) repeat protein